MKSKYDRYKEMWDHKQVCYGELTCQECILYEGEGNFCEVSRMLPLDDRFELIKLKLDSLSYIGMLKEVYD